MKKEIIKPFDLEAYKKGAKVRTREGNEVRIICTDVKALCFPIIALVEIDDSTEVVMRYTSKGEIDAGDISDNDLVIVEEVEEPEFWSDKEDKQAKGYCIDYTSDIIAFGKARYNKNRYNLFATQKQAKSALAMARISQIMANDIEHFGGVVTDEEWKDLTVEKYAICRLNNAISLMCSYLDYRFLAFHTEEQRDLFLEKYRDLVREYLMIG
jgi:hypothetical protein